MSPRRLSAVVLSLSASACDPLPRVDTMQGQVVHGHEYCNWAPISSDTAAFFDLSAGLEVKEAVGVSLAVYGYWTDPDAAALVPLQGVMTATSDAPDVVEVFSAPANGVAILAHRPGKANITFVIAGHPGSFDAPITVTASDAFVDVEEVALAPEGGGGAGGGTTGAGGEGGGS